MSIPESDRVVLTARQVQGEGLDDWRMLFEVLHARFETGDYATGLALVAQIGQAAEDADHHPDLELSYGRVLVRLSSHDVGGVTARDLRLARTISDFAAEHGASAHPDRLSAIELSLDTVDQVEIAPFWAALLDYDPLATDENGEPDDELRDPEGRGPVVWFQVTDGAAAREAADGVPTQRWHVDLRLPPEVIPERIDRVLAAGGTLVDDSAAPSFWVLADAQGNRACLTSWRGRGDDAEG